MENHRLNIVLDENALRRLEDIQSEFYGLSKSAVIRMLLARFETMDKPMRPAAAAPVEADELPPEPEYVSLAAMAVQKPGPVQMIGIPVEARTEPKVFKHVKTPSFRPLR